MGELTAPAQQRNADVARLQSELWDVLVIGGGISGAGVLREAARRGWKAALIEQRDFAWGTSSRSSKMVHGGLRYLKEGELTLTRHAVQERERLMKEAPDLVEPLSFFFADCEGRKPGRRMFQLGLWVYGLMAGRRTDRYVDAAAARTLVPGLNPPQLKGAMVYEDAVTDDARLVLRVLAEARADGALAQNDIRADTLLMATGRVVGVRARDAGAGAGFDIRARVVVNATGAWADQLRGQVGGPPMLRPLRGSHLVVPAWRLPVAQCVSLFHLEDGRPLYFYPWEGVTLIGTTDLDDKNDLNTEARITADEVRYLLAAVNDQMPGARLTARDVIACYAGVRPVVASSAGAASSASRDHVAINEAGLVTLTGGKLTTFRLMAQDALALAASLAGKTFQRDDDPVFRASKVHLMGPKGLIEKRLSARYGTEAATLAQGARPEEFECVPGTTTLWLELRVAAEHECVRHLDDLLLRRTRLGLVLPHGALAHSARIRAICQAALGWDDARWEAELQRYTDLIHTHYSLPESALAL